MRSWRGWIVVAWLGVGLALSACADKSADDAADDGPAKLVEVEGTDVKQVILTERAVERLDIQTAPIAERAGGQVAPYASVVYDENGNTWVYTNPQPLTFVRTPITVATITGDQAVLAAGPGAGTGVVTVGTAELFGTEQGIGQSGEH